MSTRGKYKVPKNEEPEVMILQVKGVQVDLVDFIRDQAAEKGYHTTGQYLNVLFSKVRDSELGNRVPQKGRSRSRTAS